MIRPYTQRARKWKAIYKRHNYNISDGPLKSEMFCICRKISNDDARKKKNMYSFLYKGHLIPKSERRTNRFQHASVKICSRFLRIASTKRLGDYGWKHNEEALLIANTNIKTRTSYKLTVIEWDTKKKKKQKHIPVNCSLAILCGYFFYTPWQTCRNMP